MNKAPENDQKELQMLKNKILKFTKISAELKNNFEEEKISLDQYKKNLENQLKHDKLLKDHLEKNGDKEKAKLVQFRIDVTERDYKEEYNGEDMKILQAE